MTQIVLDRIDDIVLARLAELAKANRLSVGEQARKPLGGAVDAVDQRRRRLEITDRVAAMTPKGLAQTDSAILIREDRDR